MKRTLSLAQNLADVLRSRTMRQTAFVLLGNGLSAALGFVAIVLVSRQLGPAAFGLFSAATAVLALATDLSDLGMNAGLIRFASLYIGQADFAKATLIFNIALKIRLLVSSVAFGLVFLLARPLAAYLLREPALATPLRIAICGIYGASLFSVALAMLQSYQFFGQVVTVNAVQGLARIAALLGLLLLDRFQLEGVLTVYVTVPLLAFLVAVFLLPGGSFRWQACDRALAGQLMSFSKWIMLSILCVTLFNRLDVFMLTRLTDSEQVGIYSSAYKLAFVFPIITGALTTVLFPKVSALTGSEEIRWYLRRVLLLGVPVLAMLPLLLLIAGPLVTFIFGSEYVASIPIFRILLAAFAISIVANPIGLVFYALDKPQMLTLLNALQLAFNFLANLWLVPRWGGVGAAWATMGVRVITVLYFGFHFHRALLTGSGDEAKIRQ